MEGRDPARSRCHGQPFGSPVTELGQPCQGAGTRRKNRPRPKPEWPKDVTTSTLKEITVSDFLGSMGVMAAALGYDCADCHPSAGSDKVDWVVDTSKKKTARKMVEMVAAINKTNFGGAQMVTCWTCHHGRDLPATTIALDALYGPPSIEHTDIVAAPAQGGVPPATDIIDKYIDAVGGAKKLATLTSFIATGTSEGTYGACPQAADRSRFMLKAPDAAHHADPASRITRSAATPPGAYNGKSGAGLDSPRGADLAVNELQGSELDSTRLDAMMSFPGQIKTALAEQLSRKGHARRDRRQGRLGGSGNPAPRLPGHTVFRPEVRFAAQDCAL